MAEFAMLPGAQTGMLMKRILACLLALGLLQGCSDYTVEAQIHTLGDEFFTPQAWAGADQVGRGRMLASFLSQYPPERQRRRGQGPARRTDRRRRPPGRPGLLRRPHHRRKPLRQGLPADLPHRQADREGHAGAHLPSGDDRLTRCAPCRYSHCRIFRAHYVARLGRIRAEPEIR